jgi:hypothetical protein
LPPAAQHSCSLPPRSEVDDISWGLLRGLTFRISDKTFEQVFVVWICVNISKSRNAVGYHSTISLDESLTGYLKTTAPGLEYVMSYSRHSETVFYGVFQQPLPRHQAPCLAIAGMKMVASPRLSWAVVC